MFTPVNHVQPLYNQRGELLGILLSPEIWTLTEDRVSPILDKALSRLEPSEPEPEPITDWETLVKFWDFKYPVDKSVKCDRCQAQTQDWSADSPRLFRLKNASMGGLVIFTCQTCQSQISKRHFKKHIECKTTPPKE